jgi:hypothetical protein
MDIPSSVEIIADLVFSRCSGLMEVRFAADIHFNDIRGFQDCLSLDLVDLPASVEIIADLAFFKCSGLTEVTFAAGSHLKEIRGF